MYDLIDRPTALVPAFEREVLLAMRRWVHAMTLAGVSPAGAGEDAFGEAMGALDRGSRDTLVVERPCAPTVSETEAVILGIWRLVDADRLADAKAAALGLVDAPHAGRMIAAMVRASGRFPH